MAKIVTKKSDIPKYAQKRIKNFNSLSNNQAILQYELIKLKGRLSKEVDYTQFIRIPKVISKSFIEEIHNIRGKRISGFKEKFEKGKPLTSYEERKEKQYQRLLKSVKKFTAEISDDELYFEPDYSIDLNEEIGRELSYSPDEYLNETGQVVDPLTAEVVPIADAKQLAREFFDRLIADIENESAQAQVSYSSYKSGRTRSAKSRQWVSDNITRGTRKLIDLINSRRVNEETELAFYKSLEVNGLAQLQSAISEYIAGLYYQTAETLSGYMQRSRVYQIISDIPVSMSDAKSFDETGYNSYEEEFDEE